MLMALAMALKMVVWLVQKMAALKAALMVGELDEQKVAMLVVERVAVKVGELENRLAVSKAAS